MIDALRALCELVAQPLTADAAARLVGGIVVDEGGLTAIHVRPSAPEFRHATVVRRPDGQLSHVELELDRPVKLEGLVAAFGKPTRPPRRRGGGESFRFRSGPCVLIANVAGDQQVTSISVRSES